MKARRRTIPRFLGLAIGCVGLVAVAILAADDAGSSSLEHWSFRPLSTPAVPKVGTVGAAANSIDQFIQAGLEAKKLSLSPEADRATLLRRLSFDLVGLPPTPEEVAAFVADTSPDAWERAIEKYLASPRYGERWGKYWLDVAGYADSNGYFNADSDRPLAYKYRDYVVRAFNNDKPFDRFVTEQLAGDELSGYQPGGEVTEEIVELLTATHFLRNAQDGTSESDGNPEELRTDRATVLEGAEQITVNSLLGLTIQCARCHAHKFEPIDHAEYYQLQAVFYPAFPAFDEKEWIKPKSRVTHVVTPAEMTAWEAENKSLDENAARIKSEFTAWHKANSPRGSVRFNDNFDGADAKVAAKWSNTAPGDAKPAGTPAVSLDATTAPAAIIREGQLQLIESGSVGDRLLCTKEKFDWTPDRDGSWIAATFDLKADRIDAAGTPAMRIAYVIAANDFNDATDSKHGGNILIDGNPAGGAGIHLDYPGPDSKVLGDLGETGYKPGRSYGVRVTNIGGGKFRLENLVDGIADAKPMELEAGNLPDGAFAFELCCGRSFIVDNVEVATGDAPPREFADALAAKQKELAEAIKQNDAKRHEKPGALALVTDIQTGPHDVHRLERGNHGEPAEKVEPAGFEVLSIGNEKLHVETPAGSKSSGRRLALAHWLTKPGSRASSLVARVFVNRVWQHHFGTGIVATPDNFGFSGFEPSHPELIEHLASEFVRSGWSVKSLHRMILQSATYRQSSALRDDAFAVDHDNRLLWRFPTQRLSAEAIRDAMLSLSGELDGRLYGAYIPTNRQDDGSVTVAENADGARRRGLYLQQRRTQVNTMLALFDTPVIVTNCAVRSTSTIPLQSLAMLNSEFVRTRAKSFAERLANDDKIEPRRRIEMAFRLATGHAPSDVELAAAERFVNDQKTLYSTAIAAGTPPGEKKASQQSLGANASNGELRAWQDFCQMLFASNAFLYVD